MLNPCIYFAKGLRRPAPPSAGSCDSHACWTLAHALQNEVHALFHCQDLLNILLSERVCSQIHRRHCDKCDLHDVQDDKHVLFALAFKFETRYLRGKFA